MTEAITHTDAARRWFQERALAAPVFDAPETKASESPQVLTTAALSAVDEAELLEVLDRRLAVLEAAAFAPILDEAWLASEYGRAFAPGPKLAPPLRRAFLHGWRHAVLLASQRRDPGERDRMFERARREARQEIEDSDAWRLLSLLQERRDRWFPPRSRRLKALRWMLRGALRRGAASEDDARELAALEASAARPRLLVISGAAGASRRYRCLHLLEALAQGGGDGRCLDHRDPRLESAAQWMGRSFDALVFQRVALEPRFEALIAAARDRGCPVLFESDDLVFDPRRIPEQDHGAARFVRAEDARRIRELAALCDAGITSTEPLAEALKGVVNGPVRVLRNAYSREMKRCADLALAQSPPEDRPLILGYASGTPTHDRDLALIAPVLAELLRRRSDLELALIGPLALPKILEEFADRVDRRPFVPWRELPHELARLAINLAPFDRGSPFVEAKSEVKFLEAALLRVPTIASPIPAFRAAISEDCGVLAEDLTSWSAALEELVADAERRAELGRRAHQRALSAYELGLRTDALRQALTPSGGPPRIKA